MSPGLRSEDLPRLTAPDPKVLAFLPRATKRVGRQGRRRHRAHLRQRRVARLRALDEPPDRPRPRPDRRRRAPALDGRRRRRDARLQALRRRRPGRPRHHGRGRALPHRRRAGAGQIFTEEIWYDANGISIPLQTYMDRIDPTHKLAHVAVKLATKRDIGRGLGHDDRPRQAGAPRDRGRRDQGPRGRVGARLGAASWTRCTAGGSC